MKDLIISNESNTKTEVFNHPRFGQVRTIEIDGEPWFVGKDVAGALGYTNPQKAIRDHVDTEDKSVNESFTVNGTKGILINESGVYSLIFGSKLDSAKEFKRWVTSEVLPSIRKHGAYATKATIDRIIEYPDFGIELLTNLKEERKKNRQLEAENQILTQVVMDYEPKVSYYDTILSSEDTMVVTQIAADYGMTAQQLNKILKKENVQHKVNGQWVLCKEYMGGGYTDSRTYNFEKKDGSVGINVQTRWTQKGRLLIHELLDKRGIRAVMDILDEEKAIK